MSNKAQPAAGAGPNTLYVFFHGLFSFVETRAGVTALVPFLPEHCYRAGEFLGETELQPRPADQPYELGGVHDGGGGFDKPTNLVLAGAPPPKDRLSSAELFCKLTLPRPVKVHSFRTVDLAPVLSNPALFSNTQVSLLPVFEYTFDDVAAIELGDHVFTMDAQNFGGRIFATLHIFSEEDSEVERRHPLDGFAASLNLFQLDGTSALTGSPKIPAIPDEVLPGTIRAEYADLHFRTEHRLALLGRRMRVGDFPPNWDDGNPPFGETVGGCTNVVSSSDS